MGDRIHDLRSYLGFSLKAFGEAIGFSGNHISRFEKNVFSPDERVIQKICRNTLGVRHNKIFINE
ncbi:helix-turn-helix domain-containing protein [Coprococcus catus]